MPLKEYYELSAMLRIQLPILLSFAILRCLIGNGTKLWVRKTLPQSLRERALLLCETTDNLLSFVHAILLFAALYFLVGTYSAWNRLKPASDLGDETNNPTLACTEYAFPRVQGLVCAAGLLALFTNSDPLALSLALSTFKAVADGAVLSIVLGALTWRASCGMHNITPAWFFVALFAFTLPYISFCYPDDAKHDRTQSAVLAASFAALFLLAKGAFVLFQAARRVWSAAWQRTRQFVRRKLSQRID